ncbi:MAG: hypothetical protein ACYTBZ_28135, partial [Planctomycetota bacterium]
LRENIAVLVKKYPTSEWVVCQIVSPNFFASATSPKARDYHENLRNTQVRPVPIKKAASVILTAL